MSSLGNVATLHAWHHEDYDEARRDIMRQIGDVSGLHLTGKHLMLAVYIRPLYNPRTGWTNSEKMQQEDIYQGKVALIVKAGPSAFDGDDSYLRATFGTLPPPKEGDWVFLRASDGTPTSFKGDGAEQVKYTDRFGAVQNQYSFDGWPCRFVADDALIGLIRDPHTVV